MRPRLVAQVTHALVSGRARRRARGDPVPAGLAGAVGAGGEAGQGVVSGTDGIGSEAGQREGVGPVGVVAAAVRGVAVEEVAEVAIPERRGGIRAQRRGEPRRGLPSTFQPAGEVVEGGRGEGGGHRVPPGVGGLRMSEGLSRPGGAGAAGPCGRDDDCTVRGILPFNHDLTNNRSRIASSLFSATEIQALRRRRGRSRPRATSSSPTVWSSWRGWRR